MLVFLVRVRVTPFSLGRKPVTAEFPDRLYRSQTAGTRGATRNRNRRHRDEWASPRHRARLVVRGLTRLDFRCALEHRFIRRHLPPCPKSHLAATGRARNWAFIDRSAASSFSARLGILRPGGFRPVCRCFWRHDKRGQAGSADRLHLSQMSWAMLVRVPPSQR